MPFKNYSTTIASTRTVGEIQAILARRGCEHVTIQYDGGAPVGIVFAHRGVAYRLPCPTDGVLAALGRERGVSRGQRTREHAQRVAWRCLKDWIDAQLALVDAGAGSLGQVFMGWELLTTGETVYERREAMRLTTSAQ